MRKRVIGIFVAVALVAAGLFNLMPVGAETAGPLDHVVISPASATVAVGGTQQFAAQGQDASNNAIDGLTYAWTIVAGGGAVDTAGLFAAGSTTGTYANTMQVSTTQGAITKTATASVTVVTPGPLDHVVVSPATARLVTGATKQFIAQAKDAANVTIPGLTYTWSVVAGGGTISTAGLFTAGTIAGSYANTVLVSVTQAAVTKTAAASVIVTSQTGQGKERERDEKKTPLGWEKGEKKGWNGGSVPPGWDKGKKTGWHKNGHDQEQEQEDD